MSPVAALKWEMETRAFVKRIEAIGAEVARRQDEAIDAACWDALRLGMTVHVHPNPGAMDMWDHGASLIFSHHIGIALEPGPVEIVWHSMWEQQ